MRTRSFLHNLAGGGGVVLEEDAISELFFESEFYIMHKNTQGGLGVGEALFKCDFQKCSDMVFDIYNLRKSG